MLRDDGVFDRDSAEARERYDAACIEALKVYGRTLIQALKTYDASLSTAMEAWEVEMDDALMTSWGVTKSARPVVFPDPYAELTVGEQICDDLSDDGLRVKPNKEQP